MTGPADEHETTERPSKLKSFLIAIPTLGRRRVHRLLQAVAAEAAQLRDRVRVDVTVLHNARISDPTLRATVEAAGARYRIVEALGYASVRNAALDDGRRYDHLLFIDDDELPDGGWLHAHVHAVEAWAPDIVFGPVVTQLPARAARWMDEGRLLRVRVVRPDGPAIGPVYSGNTSLRMSFVGSNGLRFDSAFDRSGGEDTDFFERCRDRGARIVWANNASVVEIPDPELLRLSVVLRRAEASARLSATYRIRRGRQPRPDLALRSVLRGGVGLIAVMAGLVTLRSDRAARGMRDIAVAVGGISALAHAGPRSVRT